ncbi:MAG: cupin domain-containing protein [Saprospiraceae bacterium]|nr:cupin domain-containing protein [Saprospiraceae bacterium]
MKIRNSFLSALFILASTFLNAQEPYELGPDSRVYEQIPKGTVTTHQWDSNIYPNTTRAYYLYVPAQYDSTKPAALMVFQDGHTYIKEDGNFMAATVFDNLISQEKMPVTIGLFINPGHDKSANPPESPWRVTNRSIEYDEMADTYGRFLLEEIIPEIKKNYTISDDPKMRAICGISSGGICAFTVAWYFPEHFQKVLSLIGSFTNIRGGHNYPALIRKSEKKDIKIFLQDGSDDLDNEHGNWWLSNLQMEAALKFKEYNYEFVGGSGGHSGHHGASIFPQSLTWLWSDVVPTRLESKVYPLIDPLTDATLISGESTHLSRVEFTVVTLESSDAPVKMLSGEKEQIIIVKEGSLKITIGNAVKTVGANSVAIVLPGEQGIVECMSKDAAFYTMIYESRGYPDPTRGKKQEGPMIFDFEDIDYRPHDRGGVRSFFNRSTTMCPYYEMHVTNLNPGIKSHEPHVHKAEEIILMISGTTEMEIGNELYSAKAGDVYFTGANVPHAIKNTGNEQAMYFAFQWY